MTAFSVIMPAYNYARYVAEAITSVLESSFTDFELIVIDDCSTDDTWSVLETFHDARLVVLRNQTNVGMCATLNRGLGLARGQYIAVTGADDRFHRDFLLRIHETFVDSAPELGAVGTYLRPIDAGGEPHVGHPAQVHHNRSVDFSDPGSWIWHNYFPGCAAVRREVFDGLGGFAEDVTSVMDWDLWVRMLAAGYRFHIIPEMLFDWRLHGQNITNRHVTETVQGYSLISERHLHPYLVAIGREDLLSANVAGFLTHDAVLRAPTSRVEQILGRVFTPLTPTQQTKAIQYAGDELLRLREYYAGEAARVEYLQSLANDAQQRADHSTEALREKEYELAACLDRLGAAEIDRRAAQAELATVKNTAFRRAGRKIKRAMGK